MIEELTAEQEARMEDYVRDFSIFRCGSKETIERGVKGLYKLADYPEPEVVVLESPMAIQIAANQYQKNNQEKMTYFSPLSWGGYDMGWLSFYEYMKNELGIDYGEVNGNYELLKNYILSGVSFVVGFEKIAFAAPHANFLHRDDNDELHCLTGPAIGWKDFELYFVHGVSFDKKDFETTVNTKPSPKRIIDEPNTERRAVLISLWGYDYILSKINHVVVYDEPAPSKWDAKHRNKIIDIEISPNVWHRVIQLECPSTGKKYMHGIIRNDATKNWEAARASMWRVEPEFFKPKKET